MLRQLFTEFSIGKTRVAAAGSASETLKGAPPVTSTPACYMYVHLKQHLGAVQSCICVSVESDSHMPRVVDMLMTHPAHVGMMSSLLMPELFQIKP